MPKGPNTKNTAGSRLTSVHFQMNGLILQGSMLPGFTLRYRSGGSCLAYDLNVSYSGRGDARRLYASCARYYTHAYDRNIFSSPSPCRSPLSMVTKRCSGPAPHGLPLLWSTRFGIFNPVTRFRFSGAIFIKNVSVADRLPPPLAGTH